MVIPKSKLNHVAVAPYTVTLARSATDVEYPTDAHEKVRKSFVDSIPDARKAEIGEAVAEKINRSSTEPALDAKGQPRPRVGVWIRQTDASANRTATQNMTKERFQQVLESVDHAYPDGADVVILGDGFPKGQQAGWLKDSAWGDPTNSAGAKKSTFGKSAGKNGTPPPKAREVHDFSKTWDANGVLGGATTATEPGKQRGYAEQVAVYDELYRNHNMQAIVTNKSGGPDLASLAGIPQIAMSDVDPGEIMTKHRLYFQSLASHSHTVVPVTPQQAKLGDAQQNHLTAMLQRAPVVRQFDIDRRNELAASLPE